MKTTRRTASRRQRGALRTVVLLVALAAFAFLVRELAHVLLVVFAAVLFAVFLDGMTRLLEHLLPLRRAWCFWIGVLALVVFAAAIITLAGARIANQITELGVRLPEAVEGVAAKLEETGWGQTLLRLVPDASDLLSNPGEVLGPIAGVFASTFGAFAALIVVVFVGLYIAHDPAPYRRGVLLLTPPRSRERAGEVMDSLGHALRWWLLGQLGSMAVVGTMTGLGLWLIGMPLVLALGLITALFSFVPMVGPITSAIPALLIAGMEAPVKALYVVLVYWIAQALEGNLITPQIQKRTVSLAPGVLITAQLLMGTLFGVLGVLLASPLVVAVTVLVQMLYVQGLLGTNVRVLGDHQRGSERRK
jgi:predicted PurR-regulated permease PerM